MGLVNMLGILIILAAPPLIGKLVDWTGSFQSSFLYLGAFCLVAVASTFWHQGIVNLTHLFDLSFRGRRDQLALEFQNQAFTFGELDIRGNRMARLLETRGLTRGDRLCVQLPNGLEIIDLFLACVKSGVVWFPMNVLYKEREVGHILADAEPKALVSFDRTISAGVPVWDAKELEREAAGQETRRPDAAVDGDTPLGISTRPAETGASKGAC